MDKKRYVAPEMLEMELQGEVVMNATSSINSNLEGIDGFKGDATHNSINAADANRNNVWDDLW